MKRKGSGKHKKIWSSGGRRRLAVRVGHSSASRHRDKFLNNPKNLSKLLSEMNREEQESDHEK